MLEKLAHRALLQLPPELAHNIAKWGMRREWFAPGPYYAKKSPELFGIRLHNPLGVAAGFDKYAVLHDNAEKYGFGWIEEGSFTWEGGAGNKGKRLFRLSNGGLRNR